jgi:hypothetical protein
MSESSKTMKKAVGTGRTSTGRGKGKPTAGAAGAAAGTRKAGAGKGKKAVARNCKKAVVKSEKVLKEKEVSVGTETVEDAADCEQACAMHGENTAIGICPFFRQDRGRGRISCEGAQLTFPDKESRREFVYRLCAHPEGYKNCPLQIALEHYYERKYAQNE